MAATASELRRIYSYLLGDHAHPERLPALQRALESVERDDPATRCDADRLLAIANGGVNPELTFTQLDCLRVVLSQQDFAPIVPTIATGDGASTSLVELYKRLFSEPDLGHLRASAAGGVRVRQAGDGAQAARGADLLNELSPARRLERRARRRARRAAGPRHHLQAGLAVPGDR